MSVSVICSLLVLGLATPGTRAAFGDPLTHGRDDVFEVMGQAKVDTFDIEDGVVNLDIVVEDMKGQDEIWVLDFEDFDKTSALWPVTESGLWAASTSGCSNVFSSVSYDPSSSFYRDDFTPDSPPGAKNLFNFYTKGTYISRGEIKVREDHYIFANGHMDDLFGCQNSQGQSVWVEKVNSENIVYNTTLYMTNVRPQGTIDSPEPAYVQSFAILYWRLLRVALSRFLISSTERLKPIFEYALVKPVYINDDEESGFDRKRAEVEIAFRTVTSHDDGDHISVYKTNSLEYEPADLLGNNKLVQIKETPSRGCDDPLGMESGVIRSDQIMESSVWSPDHSGNSARLNNKPNVDSAGAWMAGIADVNQWVQVTFDDYMYISGMQTQGHTVNEGIDMWVSTYKISYTSSTDGGVGLDIVQDDAGQDVIFNGNYDSETIVINHFDSVIYARRMRILPQTWSDDIGLRFEILGCLFSDTTLSEVITTSAPICNYTDSSGSCIQQWVFIVVLEVDTSTATNEMPIDATGEFTFTFYTYNCPTDRLSCSKIEIPDSIISNEITLQTTVEVTDDMKDTPRVYLKKVHGKDPTTDIRGGVQPGVSHLEQVTVDTHFFPQFLRSRLQLELTLFMVCIGSEYNTGDGCLSAPGEDKYTAFVSDDFFYRMSDNSELTKTDITTSTQGLDKSEYIHASEIHRIIFTNKALSAKSRKYTITTVFRLIERTDRRKRDLTRRDVREKVDEPIIVHQSILFRGCPPNSTHIAQELACICNNPGEEYSMETYQCKKSAPFLSIESEEIHPVDDGDSEASPDANSDAEPDGNSAVSVQSTSVLIHLFAVILMLQACF